MRCDKCGCSLMSCQCPPQEEWEIQIRWRDKWITVAAGFKSRNDAEWATAEWKQANRCMGDPFRAVPTDDADNERRQHDHESYLASLD